MRPAQAPSPAVLDSLFAVFREQGFEGASLSDLSKATGLGRSSLYHYFPDGKEQMAQAVLERARTIIDTEILGIANAAGSLKTRVRKIIATLDQIYGGGRSACLLGRMATSSIGGAARQDLQLAFDHWIEAIEKLAIESGQAPAHAHDFAQDWVARLQGALLLQAASGDVGPYNRAMDALQDLA
ncbi:TetR/AcrR family transcriptional regulator [Luteibacter aegosomaticola]|jgi:TetR/AcrR family transcriptional regulator, lmrAB and yxaGH operons repressor|uniref:TetR/AcrR family transcriptional regulator n=1 Tax=Luteibacter aegosomaticola TaxID=2911538 RepID=UPI001FF8E3B6|nr:TetR/AcrR family transcriptional regulator [Luteibacter aegosomaticola]UPG89490.1 TetR/AcrR family transcriptional regulator [Luteibacter aegosomaticola]